MVNSEINYDFVVSGDGKWLITADSWTQQKLYERTGDTIWTLRQTLMGYSVVTKMSYDGSIIVQDAESTINFYKRINTEMTLSQSLTLPYKPNSSYGFDLSTNGSTLAITTNLESGSNNQVEVYSPNTSGQYVLFQVIQINPVNPVNDNLGKRISISSDGLRIAISDPDYLNSSGCVYIYDRSGTTQQFSQSAILGPLEFSYGIGYNVVSLSPDGKEVFFDELTREGTYGNVIDTRRLVKYRQTSNGWEHEIIFADTASSWITNFSNLIAFTPDSSMAALYLNISNNGVDTRRTFIFDKDRNSMSSSSKLSVVETIDYILPYPFNRPWSLYFVEDPSLSTAQYWIIETTYETNNKSGIRLLSF